MKLEAPLLFADGMDDQDFLALKIVLKNGQNAEEFRSFLKQVHSLGVQRILLETPLSVLEHLFKQDLSLINLFRKFRISVVFWPDLAQLFSSDPLKARKYVLPALFCNRHYFKRNKILGYPVFHFWDQSPEVYAFEQVKGRASLTIPSPEDVESVFLIKKEQNGSIDDQVLDITDCFNRKTGALSDCEAMSEGKAIVVLRLYAVSANTNPPFLINYFDSSALAAIQKHFKEVLDRLPFRPESIVYPLDHMFDITQSINRVHYTPSLENVLNGIKKTIAYYYFKSEAQLDNFFLKIVFKRFFVSVLKSRLEIIASKVHYLVRAEKPLTHILPTDHQYILTIDHKHFHINTPYFWQSFSAVKQMASEAFANDQSNVAVNFASLLSPSFSLVEQKFYFDLLTQAGATQFWLTVDRVPAAQFSDPTLFNTQSAYLHQLINFLNKGIPNAQILMLMPSLDVDKTTYYRTVEVLSKSGIQFELISFDHFIAERYCKIEQDRILFKQQSFSLILLPGIRNIPYRVLKKLFLFFKSGGHLATLCVLPDKVELKEKLKKFRKIKRQLWLSDESSGSMAFVQDDSQGKSYFIPRIEQLHSFLTFYLQKNTVFWEGNDILLRVKETQHSYFVFLTNLRFEQYNRGVLKSKEIAQPYQWCFAEKKQRPVHYWNIYAEQLEVPLTFAPLESKLIIIPKHSDVSDLWRLAFCSANDFELEVTTENHFLLYLPQDQLGPVDIVLENNKSQRPASFMITEVHPPIALPDDHWILETEFFSKVIHLQDIESILDPRISSIRLRNSFMLKQFRSDCEYILELPGLTQACELRINGQVVNRRWYPPFKFRLGAYLKTGENQIDIILNRGAFSSIELFSPVPSFKLPGPLQLKVLKKFEIKPQVPNRDNPL